LAEKYSVVYAINFTSAAEVLQKLAPENYSGYSYEDQPSNIAGADFYLEYNHKIKSGEISLNAELNLFMNKMYITDPKNAPNYNIIPHIIDNFVASSYGTKGLTGVQLFNAAWEAYCKKSAAVKEKIKKAHKTLNPSANN